MLGCLPCILRLLNSLSLMPVHNGGQPLVDARIAVVLHIGDSQERQCICATRPVSMLCSVPHCASRPSGMQPAMLTL